MTPAPLLPPVSPSEAVAIADLILRTPLTMGNRAKLTASLGLLKLEKLRVYPHTLAQDPTHAQTYYIVVESAGKQWLLHMAPASAATTPLFPNPMLLARVRPSGEREIVVNAIEVDGHEGTIVRELHGEATARASNVHDLVSVSEDVDFGEFLKGFPKRPQLLPAVRCRQASWKPHFAALMSNWRDGFVAILEGLREAPGEEQAAPFSRFSYCVENLRDIRAIATFDSMLKRVVKRSHDVELDLSQFPALEPEDVHVLLDNLKLIGVSVQSVEVDRRLHVSAFAMALQPRHVGLTVACEEPDGPISGVRTHWKVLPPVRIPQS